MLDYQKFIKEEEEKQKIVRQRIADVLTKHGKMNANLNSECLDLWDSPDLSQWCFFSCMV